MPFSPRWLIKKDRDNEAIKTLSWLRKLPADHELIRVEYMEIRAEAVFEQRAFARDFPQIAAREKASIWTREFAQYLNIIRNWDNFKRAATAWVRTYRKHVPQRECLC
jgi:hypothetical protein